LNNHQLHNKTLPGSQQRNQNGHVITKARYNKQVKFLKILWVEVGANRGRVGD